MNQCEKVLKYIKEFGSIMSAEAMKELGVYRLASRINELRDRGENIKDEWLTSKNRYGENIRYKRYYIDGK